MPLTAENMESRKGSISHSIFRDIARMDDDQLGWYTRKIFTGQRDLKFLPEPFWDFWFEFGVHGHSSDGMEPNSPAVFLANLHDIIGSIARGTFRIGDEGEEQPDFSYRPRFRKVVREILDECTAMSGNPTQEQKDLASYTVEAVGAIKPIESFNFAYIEGKKGRPSFEELASIPEDYPQVLRLDLEALKDEKAKLLESASLLIRSGKFGILKLRY